jgi:hypothetical protein
MSERIITKIDKPFLARLCADAISNLQKACETHPRFPSTFTDMGIEVAQELLIKARYYNDHGFDTGDTIAEEEEMEFTVAILQGMRRQAYDELVDLITVWLRVGLHLDDYIPSKVCPVDEDRCDLCAGVRDDPCEDAKEVQS